jgi:competence ComEA-like helix-hairpin-helix protein
MAKKKTLVVVSDHFSYGEDNPPGTPIEMAEAKANGLITSGIMRLHVEPKRTRQIVTPSTDSKPDDAENLKPVFVNLDTAERIAEGLKGVAEKTAEAIVKAREENGLFEQPEDLLGVNGVSEKVLEDNESVIDYRLPDDYEE